jgi:hypothetical protein
MQTFLHNLRRRYLKWTERKLRVPVTSSVPTERIGTPYGGWIIPQNRLSPDAVCYLVGAGEDVSFDLGVAGRYGCEVHIFDPTPRAVIHVEALVQNLQQGKPTPCATSPTGFYPGYPPEVAGRLCLHPVGIWHEDTTLRFFAPQNDTHVSHSIVNLQHSDRHIEVPVRRLSGMMRELGHSRIDLLKLDIEGAEYQVVQSLLDDGIDVGILCVEFDESAANHLDTRYLDRIEGALQTLLAAGFQVIAKEPGCHNYTLIRNQ